jgi:hypothetical protein
MSSLAHDEHRESDLLAPKPRVDLDRILEEVQSQRRHDGEQERHRAEAERRREEAEARREELHRLFSAASANAAKLERDPAQQEERTLLAEQLVAIGQRIERDGRGTMLDGLPNRHTPRIPLFLPLRFAVTLLQLGRTEKGAEIAACLEQLEDHPELRPFYQWFDGLAGALVGARRDLFGFGIAAKLPLPTEHCTWPDRHAAAEAPSGNDAEAESVAVAALRALVPDSESSPLQQVLPDGETATVEGCDAGCPANSTR